MKKMWFIIAVVMAMSCLNSPVQAQTSPVTEIKPGTKVEVYYFHFTRRCETCKAVEANSKKAVEELYSDKIKSGDYLFQGINLDDEGSEKIAEKLGIGGQTLLVVCGEKKEDITDKGFLNSGDLEKMKQIIQTAVDKVSRN
ncbi:MAG: hypothetical protein HOO86_00335 [Bacteroidales bacterium]|nr:hypothetical protein [Bacteroidales bacterium]